MKITVGIIVWLITGYISAAGTLAYMQGKFPCSAKREYREDAGTSIAISIFPVLGLLATMLFTGFFCYGFNWTFRRPK